MLFRSALHAPRVAARVSAVSSVEAVRDLALTHLRAAANVQALVCDGRDIGTKVFPDAEVKVFLVASAVERARRRLLDSGRTPTEIRLSDEADRLRARDQADSTRALSPLRRAADAIEIDTTHLTVDEASERILALCRERGIDREDASGPPALG